MTVKEALGNIESDVEAKFSKLGDRLDEIDAVLDASVKGARKRTPGADEGTLYAAEGLLTKSQKLADAVDKPADPSERGAERLGAMLHAMATKDTSGLSDAEAKAVSGVSSPQGGALIPEIVSAEVIDLARNRSVVVNAGARTMPMQSRYELIPKLTAGITPAWRAENSAISEDDPTIDAVRLNAHSIASITKVSWELLEDATPDAWAMLVNDITANMALAVDYAALAGLGTDNQPLGIVNTDGVNTIDAVGTPADYDAIVDAMTPIEVANHAATTWVLNPRDVATYRKLKTGIAGDKTPLRAPEDVAALRRFSSNQLPVDGGGESQSIVGDFSQLVLGFRGSMSVRIVRLDEAFADHAQAGLIAWWRGDVALRYPEAFTVLSGITAASEE